MLEGVTLNFGRNLRELRRRKRLEVAEVIARARAANYTLGATTLYDLEANKRTPTADTINALAAAYEMTYEAVMLWGYLGEFSDGLNPAMLTPEVREVVKMIATSEPDRARRLRAWLEELSTMRDDEMEFSLRKMQEDRAKLTEQRPQRTPAPVPATTKNADA